MKMNPFLTAVYKLESEVGSIATLEDTDPRLKPIHAISDKHEYTATKGISTIRNIVRLLNQGMTRKEIASELDITYLHVKGLIGKHRIIKELLEVEFIENGSKKEFKNAMDFYRYMRARKIKVGYAPICNCINNSLIYKGKYKFNLVQKIRPLGDFE